MATSPSKEGIGHMDYHVQRPNSATNPTDRYRIIRYDEWLAYVNGDVRLLAVHGSFDDYVTADDRAKELNDAQRVHPKTD